jgi:hypothetical protein
MDQLEAPSDCAGIAENLLYSGGDCLADYVKILRSFLQEQIPYRASDNVTVVTRFFQPVYNAYRFFVNIVNADSVLIGGINKGFFNQSAVFFAVSETQDEIL